MSIKKDVLDKVVDKTNEHSDTWKGRPISTWLLGLHEEVANWIVLFMATMMIVWKMNWFK